jgi:hypothetical protein
VREDAKFRSAETLTAQMAVDVAKAQELLARAESGVRNS